MLRPMLTCLDPAPRIRPLLTADISAGAVLTRRSLGVGGSFGQNPAVFCRSHWNHTLSQVSQGVDVMKRLLFASLVLSLSAAAYAQEATLNGTVTDSTGSVLPGVTIQALHEASGNTFMAVTDGR